MRNINKKVIVAVLVIIVICLGIFAGFKIYGSIKEQERIDAGISKLDETYNRFLQSERTEKLQILKESHEEFAEYKNSEDYNSEIGSTYVTKIRAMQEYFISEYNAELEKNTVENIDQTTDKELIKNSKSNLENLLSLIKEEKEIISSDLDVEEIENTINVLLEEYKKQSEQTTTKNENKTSGNASSNSNKNNNSGGNNKKTETTTTSSGLSEYEEKIKNAPKYSYPFPDHFEHYRPIDPTTGEFIENSGVDFWMDPDTGICYYRDGTAF